MTTITRRQENVKPVTGSVRWIVKPTAECFWGRIAVTSQTQRGPVTAEYDLAAHTDKNGVIVGYGLAKDDDEVYAIDASQAYGWTCDCGDCSFRNRACKHIKAVRAALAVLETLETRMQPKTIDGNLIRELHAMRIGEVRNVNGHRVERFASAILIDECPCFSPRQIATCLAQSEPCQRPEPVAVADDEFDNP